METYNLRVWSGYIIYKRRENIVADSLSRFPLNVNQATTQKSTHKKKILSESNDTEEVPEAIFPIIKKRINQYQRKDPILLSKYKQGTYQKGSFRGGSNIYIYIYIY